MKYQVFLKAGSRACSVRVDAKNEKAAKEKAVNQAKKEYGLDFKVWQVFEG